MDVLYSNQEIAAVLERIAQLLEAQKANPHRVRAYRRAAGAIESHDTSIAHLIAAEGVRAIEALPGIGKSIASIIQEFAHSGRSRLLDWLEGEIPQSMIYGTPFFSTHAGGPVGETALFFRIPIAFNGPGLRPEPRQPHQADYAEK